MEAGVLDCISDIILCEYWDCPARSSCRVANTKNAAECRHISHIVFLDMPYEGRYVLRLIQHQALQALFKPHTVSLAIFPRQLSEVTMFSHFPWFNMLCAHTSWSATC